MQHIHVIDTKNIPDLSEKLLLPNGKLKLKIAGDLLAYPFEHLRVFCHQNARYGLPTRELINFLNEIIDGRTAIEIGAGHGDLGYHLQIPMTDSYQQTRPEIIEAYRKMRQPIIKYPSDIEQLEAIEAIYKYKPKVVIGSWITTYAPAETTFSSNPYGIKEDKILNLVETLIIVGNADTHGNKPILKLPHEEIYKPWIVSRAKDQSKNRIYIWDKRNRSA